MNESTNRRLESIKKHGGKGKGRASLIKYYQGGQLNKREAIEAKCCECLGYFADGAEDCRIPDCPLYPFFPYSQMYRGTDAV